MNTTANGLFSGQALIALLALACSTLPCFADGNLSVPSQANALKTAEQLYDFGREYDDPVALVAAARLLLAVGFAAEDEDLGNLAPWLILGQAADMAEPGSREEVIIVDTFAVPRGVLEGYPRIVGRLEAAESKTYRMIFSGDEVADAAVRLKEAGSADVDIRILDQDGQVVASDELKSSGIYGRVAYAQWVPQACGEFQIEITNRGTAGAAFLLALTPSAAGDCAEE